MAAIGPSAFDATPWLVFARAAGLAARAPALAHPAVPRLVRAGFAAALAFAVAPSLGATTMSSPAALAVAASVEALVGAAIGLGASLLYDGAYFAGRTIDDYLGVRGSVPGVNVANAQAFGRLWSSAFLVAFVLLDGWVPVVDAFAASFAHVPPGGALAPQAWRAFAFALPETIVRASLLVAAPAIAAAACVHVALAAVTRVVPRLASVALAFPLVFACALLVTLAGVPLVARAGASPWLVLPWGAP